MNDSRSPANVGRKALSRFFIAVLFGFLLAANTIVPLATAQTPVRTERAKLTAADGAGSDFFGGSVSVSGNRALIGANGDDNHKGSAYVFLFNGTTWNQEAKLTISDGAAFDGFGEQVSLSGNRALIAAEGENNFRGAVYVFVFDGTTWKQEARLAAADGQANDSFGRAVSISGNRALIGAVGDSDSTGSAYIFGRNGTTWSQETKLTASDRFVFDSFGASVSLSGDRAIVGAPFSSTGSNSDNGSAYVFFFDGVTWSEEAKLNAADAATNDYFSVVSLSGNRALIGAPGVSDKGEFTGAAYIFEFDGVSWRQTARLAASDGQGQDEFGAYVSLSGNRALIGAPGGPFILIPGAAYLYSFDGATWNEQFKLIGSDSQPGDFFGSVSLSGKRALVGSIEYFNGGVGAAYVYGR